MWTELQTFLQQQGVGLAGVADVSRLSREQTRGYPRAVCIAIPLAPAVVAGIPTGPHVEYCEEYDRLNARLSEIGLKLQLRLERAGCTAYALTRERTPYDSHTYATDLPYKTAATLAGLGWIGKNALLITKEYGAAQRLSCVLTDADLPVGRPVKESRCGSCQACAGACPGKAITGVPWSPGTERDALVSPGLCEKTFRQRGLDLSLRSATCGLCVAACPHTRRYVRKAVKQE